MLEYKTINGYAQTEWEVQKSRFISYVNHIENETQAQDFVNQIRKKHFDATHNCYAYIIGEHSDTQKSNDDGEPSGTAGVPILEVLKKNELSDVVVVVTRYFGGIKLGAGGLIRAYGKTATICLWITTCSALWKTTFTRKKSALRTKTILIKSILPSYCRKTTAKIH